jgi:hypothetical protein
MILGMPRALFPQMAHQSFGGPVAGGTTMALLAAAMSAGAVAGGVFSGWLPRVRRQGLAVFVAIVVWGLAMIGFGLAAGAAHGRAGPLLWAALGFLAVGGAADLVSAAFRSTMLQEAASDDVRGRLQGVFVVVVGRWAAAGRHRPRGHGRCGGDHCGHRRGRGAGGRRRGVGRARRAGLHPLSRSRIGARARPAASRLRVDVISVAP